MPHLNETDIASVCREAETFFTDSGVSSREIIRLRIDLEEALLHYSRQLGPGTEFRVDYGRRFGRVKVRIIVPGPMSDPFVRSSGGDDVQDYMLTAMAHMGDLPSWHYDRGRNVLLFSRNKKRMPEWMKLAAAVFLAAVFGFSLRFAPDSVRFLIRDEIVAPLMSTFLGFLNAVAGPMIFLSVHGASTAPGMSPPSASLEKGSRFALCGADWPDAADGISEPAFLSS